MAFRNVTEDFRINQAEQFIESFSENNPTYYYMFFGRHYPYAGGVVPEVGNSVLDLTISPYANMTFAKRILPSDVMLSIARADWVEGQVYGSYDHRLDDRDFYIGVVEGNSYNVFKCLFNNNGAPSTVAPSFAAFSTIENQDADTYDGYYETADGYQWKYMYTVDQATMNKFATAKYVPLVANTAVSEQAIAGSIDVIKVEAPGSGYNNFFYGEFTANSDIAYLGNNNYYALRTSGVISPASGNDYYNGCILKITEGSGAGQYREVVDYINSGGARYVIVDDAFTVLPDTTSRFEITPKVTVAGRSTTEAVGRAIMGSGNSIFSVEILERGSGYTSAEAYIKQPNVAVEANSAILVPMMPPPGGHGFDARSELGARWAAVSVTVSGDENGMIAAGQKFGQVGIVKNPMFSNVEITTVKISDGSQAGRDGNFLDNETVIVFDPIKQAGIANAVLGSEILTVAGADPSKVVYPGGRVFVSSANSEWFTAKIVQANTSALTLDAPVTFTSNAATTHICYANTSGIHVGSGPTYSYIDKASPFFKTGDKIIGLRSMTTARITAVEINNRAVSDYTAINQLDIIAIDDPLSTFVEDEYLSDASNTNSCYFHSYANSSHMFVTNVIGNMDAGAVLRNATSSATATVANKYNGQFVQESGAVIYVENHELVTRENSTAQTKKIIVEF